MSPVRLTDHFTLDELTFSQTAAREGIDNTPPPAALANLHRMAALMEQIRALLGGRAVHISSGYRCPVLNRRVGGATKSAHMDGLAVDFTVPSLGSPHEVALAIAASNLQFDQLIHEYGSWVHVGLAPLGQQPRQQLLTFVHGQSQALAGIQPADTALA